MDVHINSDEQKEIAKQLVKLTHAVGALQINQFVDGSSNLTINELKIKGKVAWDCNLPSNHAHSGHNTTVIDPTGNNDATINIQLSFSNVRNVDTKSQITSSNFG